ncbi:polyphosphate polymerase domain-containing protein [Alkaliphilus hydrothermalis]|uniref:VTC domain-containing protein n=1 Tax=Alkaliphilus hydrothermalis TaxID=1482730 RepID=A0ABS2NKT5_9FIRM|nr:hypothetical protein [Alkaliphilus hydrothermalis]
MEKHEKVYRHEIKYFIHKRQAAELRFFLKSNTTLDSNGDETGSYWIRSLYFDTLDNRDYYEKMMGHNIRKKIRLRIYEQNTPTVKLEIKNKYNNYTLKESATISKEVALALIQGESNKLLRYKNSTCNKVFALMHSNLYRPIVTVDYEREAFLYNIQNIRLTIDKNIRASCDYDVFFGDEQCMIPVINEGIYVLEIKYDHVLPPFLQKVLSTFQIQRSQVSKYCLGRNILGK